MRFLVHAIVASSLALLLLGACQSEEECMQSCIDDCLAEEIAEACHVCEETHQSCPGELAICLNDCR